MGEDERVVVKHGTKSSVFNSLFPAQGAAVNVIESFSIESMYRSPGKQRRH